MPSAFGAPLRPVVAPTKAGARTRRLTFCRHRSGAAKRSRSQDWRAAVHTTRRSSRAAAARATRARKRSSRAASRTPAGSRQGRCCCCLTRASRVRHREHVHREHAHREPSARLGSCSSSVAASRATASQSRTPRGLFVTRSWRAMCHRHAMCQACGWPCFPPGKLSGWPQAPSLAATRWRARCGTR